MYSIFLSQKTKGHDSVFWTFELFSAGVGELLVLVGELLVVLSEVVDGVGDDTFLSLTFSVSSLLSSTFLFILLFLGGSLRQRLLGLLEKGIIIFVGEVGLKEHVEVLES